MFLLHGAVPWDGPAGRFGGTVCTAICSTKYFCSTVFARPNIFARPFLLDQIFLLDRFFQSFVFARLFLLQPPKFANSTHKHYRSCINHSINEFINSLKAKQKQNNVFFIFLFAFVFSFGFILPGNF